jgi:rSAM/selenodomain-associated transferase 1
MNGAIAIFVKTPGFSPVKTRLAVKLGQQAAEAIHLASARTVKTVVQAAGKLDTIRSYFAVAEQAALAHDYWQDLPCLWQGEGGLGERMAQVYQTLLKSHDFVLLVGADIPQMTVSELLKASAWLARDEHARLAFGPSVDGGFWLFGGNVSVAHALWTEVAYSAADTGAQFFNKVGQLGEIRILATLRDVDEPEDLLSLREALLKLAEPLPEQRDLLRFLDALPMSADAVQY